ncbi:MAG: type I restriction enzyme HsdR N-terminal domain-containing protein [Prevotella sp.]|nr:type I restriction enzyme HsdR N-terminal domain-containing protein [Prevotella sp.]
MTSHERNQNKWREFCFDLIEAAKDDILEDPYQDMIEQGLRQLNWSKANGEICPKERLQIGNRKQLEPDITLKINERSVFVIEVKRPCNKLNDDNILQLVSYMRQRQVPYGLYIGDRIALFYDDSIHQPTEVWGVKIDSEADEGWRFVDFFARGSFSAERLETFCKERMNEIHTSMGLRDIAGRLAENEGDAILKEIIEHYLVGVKQYDRGLITKFLNRYRFSAQFVGQEEETKDETSEENEIGQQSYYVLVKQARSKKGSNGRDNTKYSIDGGANYFGKNRIVREIIIRYLEQHPKMTYRQLEQIFPDEMQGSYGVVRSLDELNGMEHDSKDLATRYLMKEDELLKTIDGVRFAVCNQWGAYNIPNIFRLMEKWGWNILKE